MELIALFAVITFIAFVVEALTEYFFGRICDNVPKLLPFKWVIAYIAAAVGILAAFIYQLDLIHLLTVWLATMFKDMAIVIIVIAVHPFGMVITGLCIGRGANFIHQIASTYFPAKK